MTKKPEYVDKINFRGILPLWLAMDDYLEKNLFYKLDSSVYRKYNNIRKTIRLKDVYKLDICLSPKYRKTMKELGKRINDILNYMKVDYKSANFVENLYNFDNIYYKVNQDCIYRLDCETKDNKKVKIFFVDDMIIKYDEDVKKLEFYGFKRDIGKNDYTISKLTEIEKDKKAILFASPISSDINNEYQKVLSYTKK